MEIRVSSREIIKPSIPTPNDHKTYKLCLFDQFQLNTYFPIILFYPKNDLKEPSILTSQLKNSLSETLTVFYPLAGRRKDLLSIDCTDEGMIFIETTVNITMAEFLNPPKLQFLNKLLPCEPNKVQSKAILPQLLAQVNIFNCGGIAIALCNLHTILDACSISAFLKTWTAICREKRDEISWPDFSSPSSLFPPKTSISGLRAGVLNISSTKVEAKCTIARFLFDNQAINDLRDEAKDGGTTPNPTRYQALSAFVSKHLILACRPESGESVRPAVLLHVLDMRRRMSDSLSENSIGNLLWPAVEFCDKVNENIEIKGLVKSLRDNIGKHSKGFFARVQCHPNFLWSNEAAELMLEERVVERPIAFVFTSWCNMGFNELNFGWGKPLWIGLRGGNQETTPNSVVYVDTREGIEAWLTMQEQHMATLEKDEEFLRFAVPNPNVPSI